VLLSATAGDLKLSCSDKMAALQWVPTPSDTRKPRVVTDAQ